MYNHFKIRKQNGFTLLELITVIVVISILGLFVIDRIFAIRLAAEQSSVKHLIGTLKSALGLKVAQLALEGKMAAVAKLDNSNPILLLSQTPSNYLGETHDAKYTDQQGIWYFNKKQKALIYNVLNTESFKTKLAGVPRIRHRIKLIFNDNNRNNIFDQRIDSIAGLDLIPLEKFNWHVKKK